MTIAATRTAEFNIDQMVTLAYRQTGLLNEAMSVTAAQAGVGRDFLEAICKSLDAEGLPVRTIDFENVTLTAGDYTYSLSSGVFDVIGSGMYIPAGESLTAADGEMVVQPISREAWHVLSSKSAEGNPTMFYIHRAATLELRVWPIPVEAGTIRLQVQKFRADATNGLSTLDFERYWSDFFVWELAHRLAMSNNLNMSRAGHFAMMAQRALEKCKARSNQQVSQMVRLSHPTAWRR